MIISHCLHHSVDLYTANTLKCHNRKNTGNNINNGPVPLKRHHTAVVHYIYVKYFIFCLRTILDQSSFRKTVTKKFSAKIQTWPHSAEAGQLCKVMVCLGIDYVYCSKNFFLKIPKYSRLLIMLRYPWSMQLPLFHEELLATGRD